MSDIIWKQLDGYSRYEISNTGLVKNIKTDKLISGSISQNYICVTLYPDKGKQKSLRLHRLVAQLFCPNKNNYNLVVNHKDGNTMNNIASNLEWTTTRQNTQHAVNIGKLVGRNNEKSVRRICLQTDEIKEYPSIKDAYKNTKTIKHSSYIVNVCSGRQQTAGGYKWEYVKEKTIIPVQEGKTINKYTNYLVTPEGKIYNKYRKRFIHPYKNAAGYLIIDLHGDEYDFNKNHTIYTRKRNSKRKKFRVHRLVAEYFIENPDPTTYTEVNHKNKDRTDNRIENLEWVSSAQNLQHAHNKTIVQYTKDWKFIEIYYSLNDASVKTGVGIGNISSCLRLGKTRTAGGFRWLYCNRQIFDNGLTYIFVE